MTFLTNNPALTNLPPLGEDEEALTGLLHLRSPAAILQWSGEAVGALIPEEGRNLLIVEVNDGHIYGWEYPQIENPVIREVRRHLQSTLSSSEVYIYPVDQFVQTEGL